MDKKIEGLLWRLHREGVPFETLAKAARVSSEDLMGIIISRSKEEDAADQRAWDLQQAIDNCEISENEALKKLEGSDYRAEYEMYQGLQAELQHNQNSEASFVLDTFRTAFRIAFDQAGDIN